MPFFFICVLWLLTVLVAIPLLFIRRLRFLGVHVVLASTMAVLISVALSISILIVGARLPASRFNGIVIFGLLALTFIGGGVVGLVIGMFLAHSVNKRFAWWPVPD